MKKNHDVLGILAPKLYAPEIRIYFSLKRCMWRTLYMFLVKSFVGLLYGIIPSSRIIYPLYYYEMSVLHFPICRKLKYRNMGKNGERTMSRNRSSQRPKYRLLTASREQ